MHNRIGGTNVSSPPLTDKSPEPLLNAFVTDPLGPQATPASEFGGKTDVFYVNGINTPIGRAETAARAYASEIHQQVRLIHVATNGIPADLAAVAAEKTGLPYDDRPERVIAARVEQSLAAGRDVHFLAHSRGAEVLQLGLQRVAEDFRQRGMSDDAIFKKLEHVTAETIGGASLGMPSPVRSVNYVDGADDVANTYGHGNLQVGDLMILTAVPPVAEMTIAQKALQSRSDGPVVAVPAIPGGSPVDSLLHNHDEFHYLRYREPFEKVYHAWQRAEHDRITPAPRADVAPHVESEYRPVHLAAPVAQPLAPEPPPMPPPDVHVHRNGTAEPLRPGVQHLGTIRAVDGDAVTQHIGGGATVTWSKNELRPHFHDAQAFDAAMQPGSNMNIGMSKSGVVDAQQKTPGVGWESLGQQPLLGYQQLQNADLQQSASLGHIGLEFGR